MTKYSDYLNRRRSLMEEDDFTNLDNDVENTPEQDNKKTEVLNFLNLLEGYKVRLRELHWSAESNAKHKLTDDCISAVTSYEDTLAEDLMGIDDSTITVGMLKPIQTATKDFKSLLIELLDNTTNLKELVKDDPTYAGIGNVLDDMIHNLNVTKYLERFN